MIEAALAHAGTGADAEIVRNTLEASRSRPPENYQHQMGWVLIALQNAFFHLANGSDIQAGVSATVMRGGDTDTNGAIVGALLGAAEGLAKAPDQWRRMVSTCRPTRAAHSSQSRPAEYWPDDVLALAEAVVAAGHEELGAGGGADN